MKNVSEKIVKKIKTISHAIIFFQNRFVYELTLKNIVEPDRPQIATWSTRVACWINKATDKHSEYVVRRAFTLKQRL